MSEQLNDRQEEYAGDILSVPLPHGWARASIGELGQVRLGRQRSPKNRSDKYPTKYLRAANITWAGLNLSHVLDMDFHPKEKEAYRLRRGDVLLSEASGSAKEVGKPALWNGEFADCCFQNTVIRFRPSEAIHPKFAVYSFSHYARNGVFSRASKGVGIHHLSSDRFSVLPLLLPPLNEQRRIADTIDELFSDLDAGVAAVERAQAKLTLYRAAVLKAAVEGTLLPGQSVPAQYPFLTVIETVNQGWSPKCESEASTDPEIWAVIKTTAIQPMRFLPAENKRLPSALTPRPHLQLAEGDLLMTRAGPRARAGVTCLVRQSRSRLMLCDKAYLIRCKVDRVLPAYLEVCLNAPHIVDALDALKTGISDSGLNLTQIRLRELVIPLPVLAEQQVIVEAVEDQISVIEHLEADLEAKLKSAQALRQSILRHAFTGQLVPQDPNDEPAAALLKRIAAERAREAASAKRTNKALRTAHAKRKKGA